MATALARATAICDALVNGTATVTQRQRIAAAFAPDIPEGTNEEKSAAFIRGVREYVIAKVRDAEARAASASIPNEFAEL